MRDAVRALLDLVLPLDCGGCGAPGVPWCPDCAALLGKPVRVRPPCCAERPVYALGSYGGALRTALLAYKERDRRDLAAPLGAALAAALPRLGLDAGRGGWCLVPAPSRWAAVTRRGGNHVALLADRAAEELARAGVQAAVAPALRMARGVRDSVGLDRAARQANLADRILLRPAGLPAPGAPVLLVDDVVTTGATAAACTSALLQVGVEVPAIVVLAHSGRHQRS
jgi:predicted amidophosphoribosyltransferase